MASVLLLHDFLCSSADVALVDLMCVCVKGRAVSIGAVVATPEEVGSDHVR